MTSIDELLRRIEALEQQLAADQLQPGAFSLNTKGELEEKLKGTLEAKGIILPDLTFSFTPATTIEWRKEGERKATIGARQELEGRGPALTVTAGEQSALLLNGLGQSSFAQWATRSAHVIRRGTYEVSGEPSEGEHVQTITGLGSGLLQVFASPRSIRLGAGAVSPAGISYRSESAGEINVAYYVHNKTTIAIDWLSIAEE
jgi:hypothetical protein